MIKIEWVLGLGHIASLSDDGTALHIDYERWRGLQDHEKEFLLKHEQEHAKYLPSRLVEEDPDMVETKDSAIKRLNGEVIAANAGWKVALDQRDALDKLCTGLKKRLKDEQTESERRAKDIQVLERRKENWKATANKLQDTIDLKDALLDQQDKRIDGLKKAMEDALKTYKQPSYCDTIDALEHAGEAMNIIEEALK